MSPIILTKTKTEKHPLSVNVTQAVEDRRWDNHLDSFDLEAWFAATLTHVPQVFQETEVSILWSNDAHVRALNHHYRQKNTPTNVLSFPVPKALFTEGAAVVYLGDIILSFETIDSEAIRDRKPFAHHVMHLCVHGFLHLLGFDHETDNDASAMEAVEIRALQQFNVSNPYI
ncbi:MAG: rRNA maturation RNase YbeY [Alphaproteobacteria bacterium]|nr:MAG: rRNA maturation RNase YbeY [Alphaproteobacteria bacterium]